MRKGIVSILLIILAVFLFLALRVKEVKAQGSCYCTADESRTCRVIITDSCDSANNYYAQCVPSCTSLPANCSCVRVDPPSDPNCGGTSQVCCTGNTCDTASLSCVTTAAGKFCLSRQQACCLPGGPPAGVDCTGIICGTPAPPALSFLCQSGQGIDTAIGCIPFNDITTFTGFFLTWGLGIGGGIAFILMIYAGFMIITSAGNPQRLEAGKELLTSAISGLLLLVFSVFILRIIGVNILKIPGLS